ncbi:3',5'-cyclic-nucleotide phosphodiesterase [Methylobacterium sp. J-001]|uniref:3',5'-cyclic-nucleotide phosphodiesterase n=1 Tax=Methylobacterium sp. J-001 TaxID=2836609 RepID=UPI001FB971EE|nr:3',5'-cyclic-nucleotide phosphodiesterase [Methylobacterium sp. J-001]MCJ2115674.1 3',5'-cyclic-nucleotide phosphodiesterase [Methylobacterium sp. J-001]
MTLAFALGLSLVATASADDDKDNLKFYCTGDATTYCGGLDPAGEEMKACFTKHRKDLSENCRRAIDAYTATGGK